MSQNLNVMNGFEPWEGISIYSPVFRVAGIGDFNSDSYCDVAITQQTDQYGDGGFVYVFFGNSSLNSTTRLTAFVAANASVYAGGFYVYYNDHASSANFGYSVGRAGNFNNNTGGFSGLVVGAPYRRDAIDVPFSGAVYVIYGHAAPFPDICIVTGDIFAHVTDCVAFTPGVNGVRIEGESAEALGTSVSFAGDFNGDGCVDVVGGAPNRTLGYGAAYVIYGCSSVFKATSSYLIAQTQGYLVYDTTLPYNLGRSVSGGGDFNGDGLADVLLGAPQDFMSKSWNTYTAGSYVSLFYGLVSAPSSAPTNKPTRFPTYRPTAAPFGPSISPTAVPTGPSCAPSLPPTYAPSQPTMQPTVFVWYESIALWAGASARRSLSTS